MSEWMERNLGDLISYKKGFAFKSSSYSEMGDVTIVRVSDTTDSSINLESCKKISRSDACGLEEYQLKSNDLIIATVGSWADNPNSIVGKVIKVPAKANGALLNQNAVRLRANSFANQNYIYYKLRDSEFSGHLMGGAQGSANQASITLNDIFSFKIGLPSLEEQKSIASVLSSLDDKIDLLHRQNKTLESMAETLFRQWFVVEAGDWEEGKLGDVLDLVYGKALKDDIRTGSGFPVVGSSGVVGYHSEYLVGGPGIVIGRKGTIGKVNYLFDNFFPIDTTYYIKSKTGSAGLLYEYFLLKTMNFESSDSAVPGLNRDIALSEEIKIPPKEKINQFNEISSSIFSKLKANANKIRNLEKLRDGLLPKLMSGEVRCTEPAEVRVAI